MPAKNKFCHHTLEQIRDCGLLTPERFTEIERLIEARIHPVFLRDGSEVPHAKFVECEQPGKGWLHPNTDSDHQQDHLRRTAVAYILTDEELELLNKHCLDAWCHRREAEHFAKAEKISSSEWSEGVFLGDSYFSSVAEALDHTTSMDEEDPVYLWPAKSHLVVDEASAATVAGSFIENNG